MYPYDAYTVHDDICIKTQWTNINDYSHFPSSGSLRTVKFTSDKYTNTTDSRYLEFHGTHWHTSKYPYLDISV